MSKGEERLPSPDEAAALLALLRRGDRPWSHYANTVEAAGSAVAVLRGDIAEDGDADPLTLFDAPAAQSTPPEAVDLESIAAEIRGWEAEGMRFLTVLDDEYPSNLRTVHDRPPFLLVRGSLSPADDRSIAVVGTREPTDAGSATAANIAGDLADHGFTVVSGLAQGIDTAAHKGALARGGRTVAVVGTGLRRAYPASNAELQRRLGAESAVVSQFLPDVPPTKKTFPMRNIVMSGFALATVVVEASDTSGARMQARFALGHGRPVFLLESLLRYDWAQEYAALPGTFVVRSSNEILDRIDRLTSLEPLALA